MFKAGDPIRASEVNANFAALNTAVQQAQATAAASITSDRLADGSVTAGKLAVSTPGQPGQLLALTSQGLAWQTGTGAMGPQGPQGPAGSASAQLGETYPYPNGISGSGSGDGNCAIGEIRLTAANFAGAGAVSIPANGQLLQINQNQALYAVIGTTYGGNGTTNFAVPDLRGAAPRSANGSSVHYVICTGGAHPQRQ